MKKHFRRKVTAALLALTLFSSSLLPHLSGTASAASLSGEWDPLNEWMPQNG